MPFLLVWTPTTVRCPLSYIPSLIAGGVDPAPLLRPFIPASSGFGGSPAEPSFVQFGIAGRKAVQFNSTSASGSRTARFRYRPFVFLRYFWKVGLQVWHRHRRRRQSRLLPTHL